MENGYISLETHDRLLKAGLDEFYEYGYRRASLPFEDGTFDAAVSNFVFHEVRTEPDKRNVVREALRVVKKGGVFAFHDLFEQRQIYGDMEEFIAALKAEGISEIQYIPHTEQLECIPGYVKAPWLLSELGMLYGVK